MGRLVKSDERGVAVEARCGAGSADGAVRAREREALEIVLEAGFLNRYRAVVVICRDCLF
jgi:hypothetical protein